LAGNTFPGGTPSEIGGPEAGRVTGSFNLIGPGGSGDIRGGTEGNLVPASLAGLGLAPLGNYGGPTQTIALLPGSPALRAGTALNGITTDQRGEPLDVAVDIGAFQSQGFVLTAAPGTTPQSAPTGEAFANPLAVTVVARNPAEPVAGGIVFLTVTPDGGGAGAGLSAATAVIGADHQARVRATANAIEGTYVVTAATAGGLAPAQITLTNLHNNLVHALFAGLAPPSITFGTATVTLTGVLALGARAPEGEQLAVTFGGLTQQVLIGPGGAFSATFNTAGLTVAGSPDTVTYRYTSDGTFASISTTTVLTVTPATPQLSVADSGGTFNNTAFPATATLAGVDGRAASSLEGIAPTLIYYSGTHTAAELAGLTPLAGAPIEAGTYTVVAQFAGSPDYAANQSSPVSFTIGRAGATVALDSSGGSAVFGQPITFVATVTAPGTPGGAVTFFDGTTTLGTVAPDGSGREADGHHPRPRLARDHGVVQRRRRPPGRDLGIRAGVDRAGRHPTDPGAAPGLQEEEAGLGRSDGHGRARVPGRWRPGWHGDVPAQEEDAGDGGAERRRGNADAQGRQRPEQGGRGHLRRGRRLPAEPRGHAGADPAVAHHPGPADVRLGHEAPDANAFQSITSAEHGSASLPGSVAAGSLAERKPGRTFLFPSGRAGLRAYPRCSNRQGE
jgi:hypothetical protein